MSDLRIGRLGFTHVLCVIRIELSGLAVFALDRFVHFPAVDRNFGQAWQALRDETRRII